MVGKTRVDAEWKKRFGMQCAIREHNEGESPGLKVGFWFDNTHMEYLSVEYLLNIIVDYCIETVNSGQRTQYLAISV